STRSLMRKTRSFIRTRLSLPEVRTPVMRTLSRKVWIRSSVLATATTAGAGFGNGAVASVATGTGTGGETGAGASTWLVAGVIGGRAFAIAGVDSFTGTGADAAGAAGFVGGAVHGRVT